MIYVTLAKDMTLTEARAIHAKLMSLADTKSAVHTWTWSVTDSNLAELTELAKELPIVISC